MDCKNFDSLDELNEATNNLDFSSVQLKKSIFKGTLSLSFFNNIFVQRGEWNTAIEQIGGSPNDMFTLGFCLSDLPIIINGVTVDKNSLFVMEPYKENTLVTPNDVDIIIVQIQKDIIKNEIGNINSGVYPVTSLEIINNIKSLLFKLLYPNKIDTIIYYQVSLIETLKQLFFSDIYKNRYPRYYNQ